MNSIIFKSNFAFIIALFFFLSSNAFSQTHDKNEFDKSIKKYIEKLIPDTSGIYEYFTPKYHKFQPDMVQLPEMLSQKIKIPSKKYELLEYPMQIIMPDMNIDFKIKIFEPDPSKEYTMRIIDPTKKPKLNQYNKSLRKKYFPKFKLREK